MTSKEFLDYVGTYCADHNIWLCISDGPSVSFPGSDSQVNGYFEDGESPVLAAATGKPERDWFPVLVHEFCHARQFVERSDVWAGTEVSAGVDSTTLMDLWLTGYVELTAEQMQRVLKGTLGVEHDCERRVIELIQELSLPIDAAEYAQRANAYLVFHHAMAKHRRWYTIGREPYNLPEIYSKMPTTLIENPYAVADELVAAVEGCAL